MAISLKRYISQVAPPSKSGAVPISSDLENLLVTEAGASDKLLGAALEGAGQVGAEIYQNFVKDRDDSQIANYEFDYKQRSALFEASLGKAKDQKQARSLYEQFSKNEREEFSKLNLSPEARKKADVSFNKLLGEDQIRLFKRSLKIDTENNIIAYTKSYETAVANNDFDSASKAVDGLYRAGGISPEEVVTMKTNFERDVTAYKKRAILNNQTPINRYVASSKSLISNAKTQMAFANTPEEAEEINDSLQASLKELQEKSGLEGASLTEALRLTQSPFDGYESAYDSRVLTLAENENVSTQLTAYNDYFNGNTSESDALTAINQLSLIDGETYNQDKVRGMIEKINEEKNRVINEKTEGQLLTYEINGDVEKGTALSKKYMEENKDYTPKMHIDYVRGLTLTRNANIVYSQIKQNNINAATSFFKDNDFSDEDTTQIRAALNTQTIAIEKAATARQAELFNTLTDKILAGEVIDIKYEMATGALTGGQFGDMSFPALTPDQEKRLKSANIYQSSSVGFTQEDLFGIRNLNNLLSTSLEKGINQKREASLYKAADGLTGRAYVYAIKNAAFVDELQTEEQRELFKELTGGLEAYLYKLGEPGIDNHLNLVEAFIRKVVRGDMTADEFTSYADYRDFRSYVIQRNQAISKVEAMERFIQKNQGE